MAIVDEFKYVLDNYKTRGNFGSGDECYQCICNEIPESLRNLESLSGRTEIQVYGRCGTGNWTYYPWIAVLNKNITLTAQKGLYIVYLFKKDMSGVYLTLNQGMQYFKDRYGNMSYDNAKKVASYFKEQIEDTFFSNEEIDLGATDENELGYGYQNTTILSKYYTSGDLVEQTLIDDLNRMLRIYDELASVMAENNYDYNEVIDRILLSEEDDDYVYTAAVEAIDEIKREISAPTAVDVRRRLSEVEPVNRTNKYSKLRNPGSIKKRDYIKDAKTKAEIGALGEMLALEFEIERLRNEGKEEYIEKVKRVSIESDAFGYDIVSYEEIDGEMKEIYIEVKTTITKSDVNFQVSQNEVSVSDEKGPQYCVFRIFDAKSEEPKFYKVYGKIVDNFDLNPVTYMASYRSGQ